MWHRNLEKYAEHKWEFELVDYDADTTLETRMMTQDEADDLNLTLPVGCGLQWRQK
jgi:hypothetical protein